VSKKVSFKPKHVAGPPKGKSWCWHTIDMITTEGWRALSLNCRRLLERLEVEHVAHKQQENGRLKVSYSQFVHWGIGRRFIPGAIREAIDAGFLDMLPGYRLKDAPNQYRLTYYPTRRRTSTGTDEWSVPTDEWKRRAGKSFFLVSKGKLPKATKGELPTAVGTLETAEIRQSGLVSKGEHTSIYLSGAPPAAPLCSALPPLNPRENGAGARTSAHIHLLGKWRREAGRSR